MKDQEEQIDVRPPSADSVEEMGRIDESRFKKELDALIVEAEDMRLQRMRQNRTRSFIALNLGILSMLTGVGFFGWFFLFTGDLVKAVLCVVVSIIPPILLNIWASRPLKMYLKEHKSSFMPKLAKALNGLSFHPKRGVSEKMLSKLAILPAYDKYEAEDCFMGVYKGVKVIFSEATLTSKAHKDGPVFEGIFVLLEVPGDVIEGHTILTANDKMAKAWEKTRWKTMKRVYVSVSNPSWDRFQIFSTKPEAAELMVGERLLKELSEASDIFDQSPLSVAMFGKKYIFMMIPNDEDMFEASNLFVPVTTNQHAMQCKKEIEQILEIIDVFDLYQPLVK
ncbi:MAG: DUF3137 domain-containing protein [Rhodospirillales bacterium]|nr:DUF3137 domain-containing protein [Alphaproteobacteria bacterium]MCB1839647.1 DUF3137 domain-containing protein [Alphaproteobacteria bacterium]MCB9976304.1 DUF3137 domain-containing protein [Rhodospirillales bacterium]